MCECLRNAHSGSCVCQCHSKAAYNYRRRRIDILVILAGGYTRWPDAMHIINKTPPSISASHSAKPSLSLCHHSDRKRLLCLRYPSPPNQKNTHETRTTKKTVQPSNLDRHWTKRCYVVQMLSSARQVRHTNQTNRLITNLNTRALVLCKTQQRHDTAVIACMHWTG